MKKFLMEKISIRIYSIIFLVISVLIDLWLTLNFSEHPVIATIWFLLTILSYLYPVWITHKVCPSDGWYSAFKIAYSELGKQFTFKGNVKEYVDHCLSEKNEMVKAILNGEVEGKE